MNKLMLLFIIFISSATYGSDLSKFYLTSEWEPIETNNKFKKYFDDRKYLSTNLFLLKKQGIYALVREEYFNSVKYNNFCVSETKLRYISKEMKDLNVSEFMLGKKYYIANKAEKLSCDTADYKHSAIYSVGFIDDSYVDYILKNITAIKKNLDEKHSCKIDYFEYVEQKRNGIIEMYAKNLSGGRNIIELGGSLNDIKIVRCNMILD